MSKELKTLAIVNEQKILIIENGDRMVPIKPICQALGIDYSRQKEKIESDEILSSTIGLTPTVAADGKEREMFCIPFKYVFGWLFTINPKNVKDEARELVIRYRSLCYDALYDHFTASSDFIKERAAMIEEKAEKLEEVRKGFNQFKKNIEKAKDDLKFVKGITFEEWKAKASQMNIWEQEESKPV